MANHIRKQVRDAVGVLLTGLATTGNNVFVNRLITLKDGQLPALVIRTNDEEIETEDISDDAVLARRLEVEIEVHALAVDDVDDVLDGVINEVEKAIYADEAANTLNGLIKGLDLKTISIDFDAEGEKKAGLARMSFEAIYFNQASAPDVSI
jgi:hypothetical protein